MFVVAQFTWRINPKIGQVLISSGPRVHNYGDECMKRNTKEWILKWFQNLWTDVTSENEKIWFHGRRSALFDCRFYHFSRDGSISLNLSWAPSSSTPTIQQIILFFLSKYNSGKLVRGQIQILWPNRRDKCSHWFWMIHPLGPCKEGSRDSGFKFQTDHGFWIQISNRQDSGLKFLIGQDSGFRIFYISGIQISNHFSEIHFSNK